MNRRDISILLVEDNPMDAALTRRMLQSLAPEFQVSTHWVENAGNALAEVRRRQYDLVLLDYQLPGANGLNVLADIRQLPAVRQPAVIMLTASGNEKVAVEAMKNGARDYLRKDDLDVPQLLRAIISTLAQKRLQDQVDRHQLETEVELRMARQLQYAILPHRFPVIPDSPAPGVPALKFAARYVSATDLGGDFYDVFSVSPQVAGVFICDVMGHGVRAALVTAMVRTLVEELQPQAGNPGAFLSGINQGLRSILRHADDPVFATAFYAVVQPADRIIRYANAGHPLPLLIRSGSDRIMEMPGLPRGQGPALGLLEDALYPEARCAIDPGTRVLLYTDGLIEQWGPGGEEFGRDRLLVAIRESHHLPMAEMLDDLIGRARAHSSAGEFQDDVCLLGLEMAGVEPEGKGPS